MAYKDSTAERTTITRNLRELEEPKIVIEYEIYLNKKYLNILNQ